MINTLGSLAMMRYGRETPSLSLTPGSIARSLPEKCYQDYLVDYGETDFDLMDLFDECKEEYNDMDSSTQLRYYFEDQYSPTLIDLSTSASALSRGVNYFKDGYSPKWIRSRGAFKNKILGVIK